MKAIILAAGKGTRLLPLTETHPKPLLLVGGKAILDHTLDSLPDVVTEIIIITQHLEEKIQKHLTSTNPKQQWTCVPQGEVSGTLGALLSAQDLLSDRFLVLNGDDLYDKDELTSLLMYPRSLGIQKKDMPGHHDTQSDSNGFLSGFLSSRKVTTSERMVLTGAYVLDPTFFTLPPEEAVDGELGIPHTLFAHTEDYPVRTVAFKKWRPINTHEHLEEANSKAD